MVVLGDAKQPLISDINYFVLRTILAIYKNILKSAYIHFVFIETMSIRLAMQIYPNQLAINNVKELLNELLIY